ncbi:hypothetical protein MRX96_042278 [Rhipicephalus microplus]
MLLLASTLITAAAVGEEGLACHCCRYFGARAAHAGGFGPGLHRVQPAFQFLPEVRSGALWAESGET